MGRKGPEGGEGARAAGAGSWRLGEVTARMSPWGWETRAGSPPPPTNPSAGTP